MGIGMIWDDRRKILIYMGVIAVVYLVFKYILPLVAPFVLALIFAAGLSRQVRFLHRRLKLKRGLAAFVLLVFWGGLLGVLLCFLGRLLIDQIKNVIENYDIYYAYVNDRMCDFCAGIDGSLGLGRGTTLTYLDDGIVSAVKAAKEQLMPSIMGSSIGAVKRCIAFFGVIVIFFMAVFFFTRDYDKIKEKAAASAFSREFDFFYGRIGRIIYTFIKTQLIIMGITMVICCLGLLVQRNPYWLLIGVVLGIVDALPVFGTGTILMPWILVDIIGGQYKQAAVLAAMWLFSYLVREYLEPKLMGKELGAHPLFMLAAVYVGLMLFGITGVVTGPVAFLLAKESISFYNKI